MSSTETIRLLNEALGGNPLKVQAALDAIGASAGGGGGGGGGGASVLVAGDLSTGTQIDNNAVAGRVMNDLEFTLSEAGRVHIEAYIYGTGSNYGDFSLALTPDNWATEWVLDPYGPPPAFVVAAAKARWIGTTYWLTQHIHAIVDLDPGTYKFSAYQIDAVAMTYGAEGSSGIATLY